MLANHTTIDTPSLAWFVRGGGQATPLKAQMVPKHVRSQATLLPAGSPFGCHTIARFRFNPNFATLGAHEAEYDARIGRCRGRLRLGAGLDRADRERDPLVLEVRCHSLACRCMDALVDSRLP